MQILFLVDLAGGFAMLAIDLLLEKMPGSPDEGFDLHSEVRFIGCC